MSHSQRSLPLRSNSLRGLQPWLYPWAVALLRYAAQSGFPVKVASVRRSYSSQARLYRVYLRNRAADPGGEGTRYLPAAAPGTSTHQVGRAFDLNGDSAHLRILGKVWTQWGGTYGGVFKDPVHFEA